MALGEAHDSRRAAAAATGRSPHEARVLAGRGALLQEALREVPRHGGRHSAPRRASALTRQDEAPPALAAQAAPSLLPSAGRRRLRIPAAEEPHEHGCAAGAADRSRQGRVRRGTATILLPPSCCCCCSCWHDDDARDSRDSRKSLALSQGSTKIRGCRMWPGSVGTDRTRLRSIDLVVSTNDRNRRAEQAAVRVGLVPTHASAVQPRRGPRCSSV